MSSIVKERSKFDLTPDRLNSILTEIKARLKGRVAAAYTFGSVSTGEISKDSDIDLILIQETDTPFVKRAFAFADLFQVYPKLDVLVYTQKEFDDQLADSMIGFWKSVRLSLQKIL